MDDSDRFTAARRKMIDAFVRVSDLARRAGVDGAAITAAHGLFFDGNEAIKSACDAAGDHADTRTRAGNG